MVALDEREFYAEIDLNTDLGKHRVKASSEFARIGNVLAQWEMYKTRPELNGRTDVGPVKWLLELALEARKKLNIAFDYSDDYD